MKRRVLLARAWFAVRKSSCSTSRPNHLDIEAIAWLEDFLLRYSGTILFVTHDRALSEAGDAHHRDRPRAAFELVVRL